MSCQTHRIVILAVLNVFLFCFFFPFFCLQFIETDAIQMHHNVNLIICFAVFCSLVLRCLMIQVFVCAAFIHELAPKVFICTQTDVKDKMFIIELVHFAVSPVRIWFTLKTSVYFRDGGGDSLGGHRLYIIHILSFLFLLWHLIWPRSMQIYLIHSTCFTFKDTNTVSSNSLGFVTISVSDWCFSSTSSVWRVLLFFFVVVFEVGNESAAT